MVVELIKGKQFAKKDGSLVDADEVLSKNKVICFYFSAHWCPPCRGFTPVLKDFYDEISENGDIAIVFVSSDKSEADMASYFAEHGDYLCLPFAERDLKQKLSEKFGVRGIPTLAVCKTDGTLISANGRGDVANQPPPAVRAKWIA